MKRLFVKVRLLVLYMPSCTSIVALCLLADSVNLLLFDQWRSQGLPGWEAHPEDQNEEENEKKNLLRGNNEILRKSSYLVHPAWEAGYDPSSNQYFYKNTY